MKEMPTIVLEGHQWVLLLPLKIPEWQPLGWPQIYTSSTRKPRNGATALSSLYISSLFLTPILFEELYMLAFLQGSRCKQLQSPPPCLSWYFKLQQHRISCTSLKVFDASGHNFLNCPKAKSAWGSLSCHEVDSSSTFCEAPSTDPEQTAPSPQLGLMPWLFPKCISPPWLGIVFIRFASTPAEIASNTQKTVA